MEKHLEVKRTARYWMAGEDVRAPSEVWFVLHGYRQLAGRFLRRFVPLADGTRWIVAPEALSRFYTGSQPGRHGPESSVGATWMTREDRENEIGDYVTYLDTLWDTVHADSAAPPRRTVVLGFSQGVATAARWTTLGRARPGHLVLWGDFLPPDLPLDTARARWKDIRVSLVRGDRDGVFRDETLAAAEGRRLASAGIEAEYRGYAGGHEIEQRCLQSLAADVRAT